MKLVCKSLTALLLLAVATANLGAQEPAAPQSRAVAVLNGAASNAHTTQPMPNEVQAKTSKFDSVRPFLVETPEAPESSTAWLWHTFREFVLCLKQWLIDDHNIWWVVAILTLAGFLVIHLRKRSY